MWRNRKLDAATWLGIHPDQVQPAHQVIVLPHPGLGQSIGQNLPRIVQIAPPAVWRIQPALDCDLGIDIDGRALLHSCSPDLPVIACRLVGQVGPPGASFPHVISAWRIRQNQIHFRHHFPFCPRHVPYCPTLYKVVGHGTLTVPKCPRPFWDKLSAWLLGFNGSVYSCPSLSGTPQTQGVPGRSGTLFLRQAYKLTRS